MGCWNLCSSASFLKSQDSEMIVRMFTSSLNNKFVQKSTLINTHHAVQANRLIYHHGRKQFVSFGTTCKLVLPNLTASSSLQRTWSSLASGNVPVGTQPSPPLSHVAGTLSSLLVIIVLSFPEVFIETGLEFLSNTNLYFQICEIFK